jgi:hypothetical protein
MNKFFQNTFTDVIREMSERGFVVFDITDLNRTQKHNALWLVEIAFVKSGKWLDHKIDSY